MPIFRAISAAAASVKVIATTRSMTRLAIACRSGPKSA